MATSSQRSVKRTAAKAAAKTEKSNGKVSLALHRDVKASMNVDADMQIESGRNALARFSGYMHNVAAGTLDPDVQTALVLKGVNEIIATHREKIGDPNKVPPINKQRVNEMKSIISLGTLKKAYGPIIKYFTPFEISRDDVVAISRYCRNDLELTADSAAPDMNVLWKVIKAKRALKRGGGGNGEMKARKATAAVDAISPITQALMLWFKPAQRKAFKAKAAACVEVIMREAAKLQMIAGNAADAEKKAK